MVHLLGFPQSEPFADLRAQRARAALVDWIRTQGGHFAVASRCSLTQAWIGLYIVPLRLIIVCPSLPPQHLLAVAVHEATHLLQARSIGRHRNGEAQAQTVTYLVLHTLNFDTSFTTDLMRTDVAYRPTVRDLRGTATPLRRWRANSSTRWDALMKCRRTPIFKLQTERRIVRATLRALMQHGLGHASTNFTAAPPPPAAPSA